MTILMNKTIEYLITETNLGNQDALHLLQNSETMNIEKKEKYVILTDKI